VADVLLRDKRSVHSTYFAAQTLKMGIQRNWKRLSKEVLQGLKESILGHLVSFELEGEQRVEQHQVKMIERQLILSLSSLLIVSEGESLDSLLGPLQPHPWIQVSLLTLTAEEVLGLREERSSSCLRVDSERRKQVLQDLRARARDVMSFLTTCLLEATTSVTLTLKAFSVWSRLLFEREGHEMTLDLESCSTLLTHSLSMVMRREGSEEHDVASEATTSFVSSFFSSKSMIRVSRDLDDPVLLAAATQVVNALLGLEEVFTACMESEAIDLGVNVIRVMADSLDSSLDLMINCWLKESSASASLSLALESLLSSLLRCLGRSFSSTEVAESTFCFLHHLFDALFDLLSSCPNDKVKGIGVIVQRQVLQVLRNHCLLDNDTLSIDGDEREFRIRVSDLIRDSSFLETPAVLMLSILSNLEPSDAGDDDKWTRLEVDLFVLNALLKEVKEGEEKDLVDKTLTTVLGLTRVPSMHPVLRCIVTQILATAADSLSRSPLLLQEALSFLMQGLASSESRSASSTSLDAIVNAILRNKAASTFDASCLTHLLTAMVAKTPEAEVDESLIKATAALVDAIPQEEERESLVLDVLQPHLGLIAGEDIDDVIVINVLDRISCFLRGVKFGGQVTPRLGSFVQRVFWPRLKTLLVKYSATSTSRTERTSRTLRFLIRCLRPRFLLPDVSSTLTQVYGSNNNNSCLLYVASILVDEFLEGDQGMHQVDQESLLQMMHEMSVATFTFLTSRSIASHPDVIDDFFRLCAR
jgi:hypothetical protein